MKKSIFTLFFVLASFVSINAHAWESERIEKIQEGITYKNILKYSGSGFIRLHILECDLEDERVSVEVMTAKDGSSGLDTTKSMAENSGAVAAVNGDFFNVGSLPTNSIGMVFKEGELVSSPSRDLWATFAVESSGSVLMDYFGFEGKITSPQGYVTELYQINKVPSTGGAITMLTKKWGEKVTLSDNMSAMLISGDEVLEIVSQKGEISFGDADKMLITNHAVNGFFGNFEVGDEVKIEYVISGDSQNIKEAVGGNTLLVKDGKEAYFNHNASGKAQRTALGVNKEGTTLYMVVCDGRTAKVPGLTQNQMAQELINLGVHTAINLDGGGSSTMVYRNDFSGKWDVLNTYTSLRKVSNSVGIFNKTEQLNIPYTGRIKPASKTVLKGDYIEIYYKFTDKNGHIVYPENGDAVAIKTDGKNDTISGNKVYFNEGGPRKIYVTFDGVTLTDDVYVLDEVSNILIYPENITVKKGEEISCSVTVWDGVGNKAYVHPEAIDWISDDVKVTDGKVGYGEGYIGVEIDGVYAYASVNGGKTPKNTQYKSSFERGIIEGGKTVRISAGSSQFTTIADMIRTLNFEYTLEGADKLYLLRTPIMRNLLYNAINKYSENTLDGTKIISLNSEKGGISQNGQIDKILKWENITQKNIVIVTENNLSGLTEEEATLFADILDKLSKNGKNIFYLYNDQKSRIYFEDGITFIGYPDVTKDNSEGGVLGVGTIIEFYIKNEEISFSFK